MILINTQVVRQGCRSHVSQWLKPKLCNTTQDPDQYLWNVYSIRSLAISSVLWLTYAFNFCDIYSCLTFQCSETWLNLFTNIFWSSFSTACSDPWTSWKTLKTTPFGVSHFKILLRTCSFIFPWPGYIANRGRTDVPPERTWRPDLRATGPKQGESAKRARLRVQLEFICLSSSISKGKAAIIVFVYLTIIATLLIDLLACVPLFKYG